MDIRERICRDIQEHNKFIPVYNQLTEAHLCLTAYELESTLYREYTQVSRALEEAKLNNNNNPVHIGDIGPLIGLNNKIDYVEVYMFQDGTYLTKRINECN